MATHYNTIKQDDFQTSGSGEVTIQAIADRCGVALSTASLALRGHPKVKPQTAQYIMDIAKEMGYDPAQHDIARRLALKKYGTKSINRTIAVCLPLLFFSGSSYYFTRIYYGILDTVQREKIDVLTVCPLLFDAEKKQLTLSPFFRRGEIDGIIMFGPESESLIPRLREIPGFGSRPICTLFDELAGAASIRADDGNGIYEATRHLLALDHRHICLLVFQGQSDPLSQRRIAGAKRAFDEFGLDASANLHLYNTPSHWLSPVTIPHNLHERNILSEQMLATRANFQQYLREYAHITAYIGLNDATALNIWYACTDAGLAVPDDISIIGFDDTDSMMGPLGEELLTTVHVPLFKIGQQVAQQLLKMIDNAQQVEERLVLPTNLIVRASTACATHRDFVSSSLSSRGARE